MKHYNTALKKVYDTTLKWGYNVLLLVLGVVLAIAWALINAVVAFLQTWFLSPLLRVSLVVVRGFLPIILEPLGMLMKVCAGACGCDAGCFSGGVFGGGIGRNSFGLVQRM